jgi:hypothetical protein
MFWQIDMETGIIFGQKTLSRSLNYTLSPTCIHHTSCQIFTFHILIVLPASPVDVKLQTPLLELERAGSTGCFTVKRNVQVRWSPNSAGLVAVLCDDCPNQGPKIARIRKVENR